jgi:molecular chaperone DnaK
MYAVSEKLYKAAAPQQPVQGEPDQAGQPTQDAGGNNVYDAEYKDVNDDNKK